jgi:hypothetical protein
VCRKIPDLLTYQAIPIVKQYHDHISWYAMGSSLIAAYDTHISTSLHGLPRKATDLCSRRVLLHRSLIMQVKIAHVGDSIMAVHETS